VISATVVSFRPWSGPRGVAASPRPFLLHLLLWPCATFCQRFVHAYVRAPVYWCDLRDVIYSGVATASKRRGRVRVDSDALRRLREGRPLTVRELAERSGVSHNTITMIENRHRTANPSTVRKLAAALDVEPRDLIAQAGE
jgi:DNA-binding Xre family transcriptional regulator